MTVFNFTAIRSNGEKYKDTIESLDKFILYKEIKKRGDTVIDFEAVSGEGSNWFTQLSSNFDNIFGHVSTQEKIVFARNLGAMIAAGLSLSRALSVLFRQSKNKAFISIVKKLNNDISGGKTLSDAMKGYPKVFSDLFTSMVRAGEESGGLSEALKTIAMQMDNSDRLQKKIKGAMIYPAVIISVVIIVGILMFIFVIPGLTATFKELNVELPFATRIIVGTSDFMKNNMVTFLGGLFALIAIIYTAVRTKQGHSLLDTVILRLPVFGTITKEINSARTARTLSSLMTSGVPIADALKITEEVLQNHYYRAVIVEAENSIAKGEPISAVFAKNDHLYPVLVGEMMSVGEETGKMPDMLMGVATFYETEVDQKTKDMSTIIEPVLMVIIGAAVGFFAIAMIMPIYSLMDNV